MGLMKRIEEQRAREQAQAAGTWHVAATTSTGEKVTTSPWVDEASKGARMGQPLNGRGLPVRVVGGARG